MTPSRDKEPVFEVTGMPANVDRAKDEIEAHIALRTGSCGGIEAPGVDNNDFQFNGTDVSFDTSAMAAGLGEAGWLHAGASSQSGGGGSSGAGGLLPVSINGTQRINSNINGRISSTYRNDSSSSLGSGSSSADSFHSSGNNGNRMADFSPTGVFNANANNNNNGGNTSFWFGESLLGVGSEELANLGGGGGAGGGGSSGGGGGGGGSSSGFDPLTISTAQTSLSGVQPQIWSPFVDHQPLQPFEARHSQVSTPSLGPFFKVPMGDLNELK